MRLIQFLAIVLTALALVPAGAHLASLPNKIGLDQGQYFITQAVYRGWALFGIVLFGALIAQVALVVAQRRSGAALWFAVIAFLLLAASLAVFFTGVYPTNQATANWTVAPANWQALRRDWEYGHAASAVLNFMSLCSVVLSVLLAYDRPPKEGRL